MSVEKEKAKKRMIKVWDDVAPNFGTIGPRYWDLFGGRLVELATINDGAQVLDIGTGRGSSLFPAIAKVGLHGHVTGIDISEGMVCEAKADIHNKGIKNAIIMQMDANKLTFNDASFDNILCGFALGAITQEDNTLSEVLRVLKSDGQIGLSIWGVQEDNKWLVGLGNKYLKITPPAADSTSNFNKPAFDAVKWIATILTEAGFKDIYTYAETSNVIYKDEEEWWNEMWSNAVRYTLNELKAMGDDALQGFKSEAFEGLSKYKVDNEICFKRAVIYAFGRK